MVDSSVFISMLRSGRDPALELAPLSRQNDPATCGVVRCEVLRGMRTDKSRQAMKQYLDCLLYIPSSNPIWEDAEELLWILDRKGYPIPLADAVIAACARKDAIELNVRIEAVRPFDVSANVLSSARLTYRSGWRPLVGMEEGMERTWNGAKVRFEE